MEKTRQELEMEFYDIGYQEGVMISGGRYVSPDHILQSKYFSGYHDGLRERGRIEKLSKKLNLSLGETLRKASMDLFKREFGEDAETNILPELILENNDEHN